METLLETGTLVDNRYRVIRQLGQGGFATVYEAEHISLGRSAALKVLDTQGRVNDRFLKRFEREARIAANFEHTNVVRIFDFGVVEATNQPFMAMEMLDGWDLEEELRTNGAMSPERAVRLFEGALDALALAHAKGIIHKDLKPSNLYISNPATHEERLVILDFGIARMGNDATKLTQTGAFAGTPAYLAPEYIQDQVVTPAFDVYQMGLILAEAITGRQVVNANSSVAYLMKHIQGEFEIPREVLDSAFGPVLLKAIETDPAARYPNAGVFHSALLSIDTPRSLGLTGQKLEAIPDEDVSGFEATLDSADSVLETGESPTPSTSPSRPLKAIGTAPTLAEAPVDGYSPRIERRARPVQKSASVKDTQRPKKKRSFWPWAFVFMGLGSMLLVGLFVALAVVVAIAEEDERPQPPLPAKNEPATVPPAADDPLLEKLWKLENQPADNVRGWRVKPRTSKLGSYLTILMTTAATKSSGIAYEITVDQSGLEKPERISPPTSMAQLTDRADVELDTIPNTEPSMRGLDRAAKRYQTRLKAFASVIEEIRAFYEEQKYRDDERGYRARRHWGAWQRESTRYEDARKKLAKELYDELSVATATYANESDGYVQVVSKLASQTVLIARALQSRDARPSAKLLKDYQRALAELEEYAKKNPKALSERPGASAQHTGLVQVARQLPRDLETLRKANDQSRSTHLMSARIRIQNILLQWTSLTHYVDEP